MAKVKAWKEGSPDDPGFPEEFDLVANSVLQVTDIKTNRNKYYSLELHRSGGQFRVYTHYGRTDDLESNPHAGVRESRYFTSGPEAEACYQSIFKQKTSKSKGYKEISLASSRIGSPKLHGKSSGHLDSETLQRLEEGPKKKKKPVKKKSELNSELQSFIRLIYDEATNALTSTVAAKITANGIETPLGVLTLGQLDKGQKLLDKAYKLLKKASTPTPSTLEKLTDLSGEFYTVIPHRIGRTRVAAQNAVIDSLADYASKEETLQLMRDMLKVNGGEDGGNVLFDDEVDAKYKALGCSVEWVDPKDSQFDELKEFVERSQIKVKNIKVKRLYRLRREHEHEVYDEGVGNHQLLFHGSRPKNWVGILSRGILLPKVVVTLGVNRTDAGWLGSGIYFGNAACTSLYYTEPGKRKTRMMAIARVALGKSKEFKKITYNLDGPPSGYDSCHGVRSTKDAPSQFEDDELVVYRSEQQRLEYLVEYVA